MALDGAFLSFITSEINKRLENARVDKIQQPEKDEIDLVFRLRGGSEKLLLSASSNNPRMHFTKSPKENPAAPPMFCMLLRKHLSGAKFTGARQPGLERLVFLDFDCYNELGDEVRRTLAVEVMGRCSNIILLDENDRIMDAVKHIDVTMSSRRQILPGLSYELPPAQQKTDVTAADPELIALRASGEKGELHKALIGLLQGVSPVVCRELAHLSCRDASARAGEMTEEQKERLVFFLRRLQEDLQNLKGTPVLIADAKTGKPLDFSFFEISQYGTASLVRRYESFSELLDAFYSERDRVERISQRSRDMLGIITRAVERISRKLDNQRTELKTCEGRETLRVYGDLLSTNLFGLQKGMRSCTVENYYDGGSLIEIRLDPMLTPVQNAQKYYREYRKASTAEKFLKDQIGAGEKELAYLDTVFDELSRASGESELMEIREELIGEGYLKKQNRHTARLRENAPLRYRSSDGFEILAGRNNRQNDRLSLKTASKNDLWMHTRNIPGSHVVIVTGGRKVPDRTLTEAAVIAALHSRSRDSSQVPVDYTQIKYVKKPANAKPGMVIYENFKTAFVNPDPGLEKQLKSS